MSDIIRRLDRTALPEGLAQGVPSVIPEIAATDQFPSQPCDGCGMPVQIGQ